MRTFVMIFLGFGLCFQVLGETENQNDIDIELPVTTIGGKVPFDGDERFKLSENASVELVTRHENLARSYREFSQLRQRLGQLLGGFDEGQSQGLTTEMARLLKQYDLFLENVVAAEARFLDRKFQDDELAQEGTDP